MYGQNTKTIKAHVDAAGNVNFDAVDFKGVGCAAATEVFLKALGGPAVSDNKKPEYYQGESVNVQR